MATKETKGFSDSSWMARTAAELGITDREDVCERTAFREHAFSREKLASFSYCEGDTCLRIFDTPEEFEEAKTKAIEFYKKY